MLVPLVLGYLVGAVGFYTLLSKTAPVLKAESVPPLRVVGTGEQTEVIELFPDQEQRRAA